MRHTRHHPDNIIHFPSDPNERLRLAAQPGEGEDDPRLHWITPMRSLVGWIFLIVSLLCTIANYRALSPSSLYRITSYAIAGVQRYEQSRHTIPFASHTFSDAALFGTGLAYADHDALYLIGSGNTVTLQQPLGYSNPVVETAGGYALAYDRGGVQAVLTGSLSERATFTTQSDILSASLSSTGHVTLITNENRYRTAFSVYNVKGDEVLKLQTSEYYILSAVVLPSAHTLAVLAFHQTSVTPDTHVMFYSLSNGKLISDCTLSGTLGLTLCALTDHRVGVLTDNGLYTVERNATFTQLLDLPSEDLLALSASEGVMLLAVRSYESNARAALYVLRGNNALTAPCIITEMPSAVSISATGVAVLTASGLTVYDNRLLPVWQNAEAIGARRILLAENGIVYALYASNARMFHRASVQSKEVLDAP